MAFKNWIDDTSTTVTPTTPGHTLDLRNRTRLALADQGVPVELRVFGTGAAGDTGAFLLLDADGNVALALVLDQDLPRWYSARGYLPATLAKYDPHYGGNTLAELDVPDWEVIEIDRHGDPDFGQMTASIGSISLAAAGTVVTPPNEGALSASIGNIAITADGINIDNGALSSSIGNIALTADGINIDNAALSSSIGTITGTLDGTVTGGSSPPAYQAQGTPAVGNSAAAISPAWPTHQANDIALLILSSDGAANHTLSDAQGFVEVTDSPQSAGSGIPHLQVWWCRASGSSMAAPTIADSADDSQKQALIVTYRGCATSGDPWDDTAGDTATTSTSVSVPGGTTSGPNRTVVAIVGHSIDVGTGQSSSEANADLTSVTERVDVATTQGNGNGIVVIDGVKAAAGAFGATTATLATTSPQARIMIALKP